MGKVRFELNRDGVREILTSPEMAKNLEQYGKTALIRLGEGYSGGTLFGKNRVNVQIQADTIPAKRENLKNNTIIKAVYGK